MRPLDRFSGRYWYRTDKKGDNTAENTGNNRETRKDKENIERNEHTRFELS